jgi:hypothetical protein
MLWRVIFAFHDKTRYARLRGEEEWAPIAVPLRGMKAEVKYHMLTSPYKPLEKNSARSRI